MTDVSPFDGRPVFLGIGNRLRVREDEINSAIEHVAQQASRYHRMVARYQITLRSAGRFREMGEAIQTDWDRDLAQSLVESVQILDQFQDDRATYVLATVEGIPELPMFTLSWKMQDGEPEWVTRPPRVPGYIAAVGAARRFRQYRDSMDHADQAALQEVLMQMGAGVQAAEGRVAIDGLGSLDESYSVQNSSAEINNFLVVARYTPENGSYFYSLVLARRKD